MAAVDINWNPSNKDLRVFASLQIVFFALVSYKVYGHIGSMTAVWTIMVISTVAGIIGCIAPALIRPIYIGWMAAVFPIGLVVSNLMMMIVFFLVISPIALIMKLLGRDPMHRKFDSKAGTYWIERHGEPASSDRYFRQF